jgi:hypothetical protein
MTSPRRIALLSLATLLTAFALANIATTRENGDSADLAQAGIEREGDIPLPVA